MAEKIKLLELDIDVNQLVKNATEAKKTVEGLKTELGELKKKPKENAEEIERLSAVLKNANTNYREAANVLAKYTDVQDVNNLTIKEARNQLAAISVLWADEAKLNGENTDKAKQYADAKLLLTERIKAEEAATGDNRRNVGNYTQSIIEAGKNMGVFGGTFGNIIGSLQGMQTNLVAIRGGLAASAGGATGFAGAMNVVKVAIASTGIGLLIVAVGLLIGWLSKIDPVVDKTQQFFAAFGAAIDVVKSTILSFIENIKSVGDLFSKLGNILAHPIDAFKDLAGNMAEAAVEAANLKEAQQNLADAQQVQEVMTAKANQQVRELIVQSKNRSLSEKDRQDLLAKAAKIDQEDFERKSKLAEEDLRIATQALSTKAKLSNQEIAKLKEVGVEYAVQLLNRGLITDTEVENLKKAQLSKIAILDETTTRQEKIQNQSDALEEKAQAKREAADKKAEQAAKDAAELTDKKAQAIIKGLQLEEQEFELHHRTLLEGDIKLTQNLVEKENEREAIILAKKKEALEKEYVAAITGAKATIKNAELLKQTLENLETEKDNKFTELDNEFYDTRKENLKKLAEQVIKNADEELAVFRLQHESRIKDGQLLTDELIQQEIDRLTVIKDAAEEIERQRFLSGQITADEFRTSQLEAEKGFLDTQQGLYTEAHQQKLDAKAIDFANDLELQRLQGESEYLIQIEQLTQQEKTEIESAEKVGANTAKIRQKYALQKEKIDKLAQDNQIKLAGDALGQISELLGKNTTAGKAAAIAQATINTYLGVSQVLAAPPSGPEPMNTILKAVSIATTIGTGIANVAKIVAVKDKFAEGGAVPIYSGRRINDGANIPIQSNGDNILATVKSGEVVLNQQQQARLGGANTFRSIGVPGFDSGGAIGSINDGGYLQRSLLQGMDITSTIVQAVGAAFDNTTIITKVTDVISETGKYNSLVDGASIG